MHSDDFDQDIRECYNFACANYVDGDSIILVGFSRGAFTARSVADLIASVGLLTTEGMDKFFPIFRDYENIGDAKRSASEFLFQELVPYHGEKGKAKLHWENERKEQYKQWLKSVSCGCMIHRSTWICLQMRRNPGRAILTGTTRQKSESKPSLFGTRLAPLGSPLRLYLAYADRPTSGSSRALMSRVRLRMPFKPCHWTNPEQPSAPLYGSDSETTM